MISKRCKICKSDYRVEIETFLLQGFSEGYCVEWLGERGIIVNSNQIKNHILKHTQISVTVSETVQNGTITHKTEEVKETAKSIKIDIPEIPDSLEFNDLVTWVQNSIGRIFIKQCSIVEQTQALYMLGEIKHPTEQIRGLKNLSDVLDLAWGYKPGIDLSRAISVIEAEGYSVIDDRADIDNKVEKGVENDLRDYPEINLSLSPANPVETEEG